MNSDITTLYRNVFGSREGQEVLRDLLINMCHFGEIIDSNNPQRCGETNVGVAILTRLGIYGDKKETIKTLMNSPVIREKEEPNEEII